MAKRRAKAVKRTVKRATKRTTKKRKSTVIKPYPTLLDNVRAPI